MSVWGRGEGETEIPINERLCRLCNANDVDDEFHYRFNCNKFAEQHTNNFSPY